MSEVSALCDQILIISKGKLVACDTPQNLSSQMQGNSTLQLSVLDPEHKIESVFDKKFEGAIQVQGSWEQDVWSGTLQVDGMDDIRAELFYLLAEEDCPILELSQSRMSLEDIFLELTEAEQEEQHESNL